MEHTHREKCIEAVNTLTELEILQEDLDILLEYSTSIPTGQHEGKRWKKNMNWHNRDEEPVWAIFEYGKTFMQRNQEMRDIKHFKPVIIKR